MRRRLPLIAAWRQAAAGLGNRLLQIGRSGPFLTVFLAHGGAMGLQIRHELAWLVSIFAFGARSPTASYRLFRNFRTSALSSTLSAS
jgi:hypothetical protein